MIRALACLFLAALAVAQGGGVQYPSSRDEYVSLVSPPGWIAGICGKKFGDPSCPKASTLEWRSKKQCIYRCVVHHPLVTACTACAKLPLVEPLPPIEFVMPKGLHWCNRHTSAICNDYGFVAVVIKLAKRQNAKCR